MFALFKNIFKKSRHKTIEIFEQETKVEYSPRVFDSFKALSLPHCQLSSLSPLSPFVNLEVLNLNNNNIVKLDALKKLKKLKILDLRFNKITHLPNWLFSLEKELYLERLDEEQEGIFLEGNPLGERLIEKIKKRNLAMRTHDHSTQLSFKPVEEEIPLTPLPTTTDSVPILEQLYPLKREHLLIFKPSGYHSLFIDAMRREGDFYYSVQNDFRVNISLLEYDKEERVFMPREEKFRAIKYILLLLKEEERSLYPYMLEFMEEVYPRCKLFLVVESEEDEMEEKIEFFKAYNYSVDIVDMFYLFNATSREESVEKIIHYLYETTSPKSLWRESWLALLSELEDDYKGTLTMEQQHELALKYQLSPPLEEEIFSYFERVGSLK